jgi:hypothetical protein
MRAKIIIYHNPQTETKIRAQIQPNLIRGIWLGY